MKTYQIVPALFLCLFLTACNTTSTAKNQTPAKGVQGPSQRVVARLMNYYSEWEGVPHCDGGMSKQGVDSCSFTYLTFREKFGIRLPRSTSQLANTGRAISRLHLQPGDLVFFKVTMGAKHVGIYMGDHKFMHASKTDGVMMSRLDSPYWHKHYWQSRRVASL